jgi:hypothetical protein
MAFTPEGMFYLGKEDVEPTIGLAGQGIRGMLGVQNEEEAVKSLMAEADFSTSEGKEAFLQQLQSVSPDAYTEFSKQFLDYDTKMFAKQSKITKANTPSKDSYDEAGNLMFGHLDTPGMQEQFMRLMYPNMKDDEIKVQRAKKGFNAKMTKKLERATKSFSRYIEGNYKDKESLNTLLANPTALMDEFKKFSAGFQNEYIQSLAKLLITQPISDANTMGVVNPLPDDTDSPEVLPEVLQPDQPGNFAMGNPFTDTLPNIPYEESYAYTPKRGTNKGQEQWSEYYKGTQPVKPKRGRLIKDKYTATIFGD